MWAYSQMDGSSSTEVINEKADRIDPPFLLRIIQRNFAPSILMG